MRGDEYLNWVIPLIPLWVREKLLELGSGSKNGIEGGEFKKYLRGRSGKPCLFVLCVESGRRNWAKIYLLTLITLTKGGGAGSL